MFVRIIILLVTVPLVLGIWWFAASEQGTFRIVNNTEYTLDNAVLESAAAPLIEQRADVAVYLLNSGDEAHLWRQLDRHSLGYISPENGETPNADTVAIYVSLDPEYSAVVLGDYYGDAGDANALRTNALNPLLLEGDPPAALLATVSAAARDLNSDFPVYQRYVVAVVFTLFMLPFILMAFSGIGGGDGRGGGGGGGRSGGGGGGYDGGGWDD